MLETCSSGGNRFDLGMLCFGPQIWASDNTDPIERLKIKADSHIFILSLLSGHTFLLPASANASETPGYPLQCFKFGCLGYELDLKYFSPEEKKDIKEQIVLYKKYRKVFQYGRFFRIKSYKDNKYIWQVLSDDRETAITGLFQTLAASAESSDKLRVVGLREGKYSVHSRPQRLYIKRFGALAKHVMPVELNPDGIIMRVVNRHYSMKDCTEAYICSKKALEAGIPLNEQYVGTGHNEHLRMLGDFGSNLYITSKTE